MNVTCEHVDENLIFMFAIRDIDEGEELLIDYCEGVNNE